MTVVDIYTDASSYCPMGSIIIMQNGKLVESCWSSQKLNDEQKSCYSAVVEKEILSVVLCLKAFHTISITIDEKTAATSDNTVPFAEGHVARTLTMVLSRAFLSRAFVTAVSSLSHLHRRSVLWNQLVHRKLPSPLCIVNKRWFVFTLLITTSSRLIIAYFTFLVRLQWSRFLARNAYRRFM